MVLADSNGISRVPPYLRKWPNETLTFRIRDYHPLWLNLSWFNSPKQKFSDSPKVLSHPLVIPRNPNIAKMTVMTLYWFRLFPVRSPLLWESLLFSFPAGTEMFHFPALTLTTLYIQVAVFRHYPERVLPFGNPRIKGCLHLPEAYRSLPRPSSPSYAKASTKCPY